MKHTIRVLVGGGETVTLIHDHRNGPFSCPKCGHMVTAKAGARCARCGAGVASVQATYPMRKRRPIEEPAKNRERDGMLGCLYGLWLRSRGLEPAEALKAVREKYPHLHA